MPTPTSTSTSLESIDKATPFMLSCKSKEKEKRKRKSYHLALPDQAGDWAGLMPEDPYRALLWAIAHLALRDMTKGGESEDIIEAREFCKDFELVDSRAARELFYYIKQTEARRNGVVHD